MSFLKMVQECGIVGAGGAGFPSHVKYNASAEIVIMNAAECEPLLHKDKEILKKWPALCVEGMKKIMAQTGAKRGILGIKKKYHEVFEALKPFLSDEITFCELDNFYPAGDEITLVYETTGRVVAPGHIPLSVGCIVTNVETIFNVARAIPVTTSFLSIAGEVEHPVSLEVPIGLSVSKCLEKAGNITCKNPVMILGGVMMGKVCTDFEIPVTKTMGGIIILDRSHPLIHKHTQSKAEYDRIAKSSCDQCSFCTELCPRFLLGHPIEPHKNMRNKGFSTTNFQLVAGAEFCCECNLCSFYSCPEDLDPKNVSTDMKIIIRSKTEGRLKFEKDSGKAHPMSSYRKTPLPKLMKKIGMDQFINKAPLIDTNFEIHSVKIPLLQHLGAPARAIVKVGNKIRKGQVIARPEEGKLSTFIHASIDGTIKQVNDFIVIEG